MSETLEKLYYGMINPREEKTETRVYTELIKDSEYFEALITKFIGEDNEEMRRYFNMYKDSMLGAGEMRAEDMFYKGFRLGARLMNEALCSAE